MCKDVDLIISVFDAQSDVQKFISVPSSTSINLKKNKKHLPECILTRIAS